MKTERFDKKLFKQEVLNNLKTQSELRLIMHPSSRFIRLWLML